MTARLPRRRAAVVTATALLTAALVPGLTQLPALAGSAAGTPGPTPAASRTLGDPVHGLRDIDVRGRVAPTALQRGAVSALGPVDLRWNELGTPASILPKDGSLGTAAGTPVDAARGWITAHAALLGLDAAQLEGLELVNDQRLVDSDAHAVLFRQTFGGLKPASGSLVTVGVADGKIAYVSSSLTRTTQARACSGRIAVPKMSIASRLCTATSSCRASLARAPTSFTGSRSRAASSPSRARYRVPLTISSTTSRGTLYRSPITARSARSRANVACRTTNAVSADGSTAPPRSTSRRRSSDTRAGSATTTR